MPERHNLPRHAISSLWEANAYGQLVRIECQWCSITRFYRPDDLIQLMGNRTLDRIAWKMRCDRCKRQDYLNVSFFLPTAREMEGRTVRRLVRVQTIRWPIWRDEPA